MSPSRRPRRSASGKAAQYNAAKIFAQLLDSSSSGTEEAAPDLHSDTPQQPEAGAGPSTTTAVRNSPQKRIEVSSSGSSESGSNFDPEEGKDQQRAPGQSQQSGPSTDDSEDDVQDEEEEEEEDELGQNPEPDSDEDSVVDMSIRKIKPLPKLKGSQLTQNRAKVPKASTSKIPAVAAAATYGAKLRKKPKAGGDLFWASVPPQAMHGARAMMNHRYLAYEEAWGYDALESDMLHLTKSAAHPSHTRSSHPEPAECLQDVGLNHTTALDSSARQRLNHAWRCTPFGPTYGLCQDSKWSKGKRTTPKSWGGWYNKMQLRHQTQKLSFECAILSKHQHNNNG